MERWRHALNEGPETPVDLSCSVSVPLRSGLIWCQTCYLPVARSQVQIGECRSIAGSRRLAKDKRWMSTNGVARA